MPRQASAQVAESRGRGSRDGGVSSCPTSPPSRQFAEGAEGLSCLGKAKLGKKRPDRPCGGYYMRHLETGVIVPARCNSHLCPACSPLHQMTARVAIERGLVKRFAERDCRDRVLFLTLTDKARAELSLPKLTKRWYRLLYRLEKEWGAGEYARVAEFQARGALHPHVFLEVHDQVADDLRDRGSEASYFRRMEQLRPWAINAGFGQMVDAVTVRTVDDRERVARYAAKSVAGYATKEAAERFKRAGAKRVRPIALSRGWVSGGLEAVRSELLGRDELADTRISGGWERIPKPRTC